MSIGGNILNLLNESEELNEAKPSLAFDQNEGIHEFTDLIKMDGGEPANEFEAKAMELDRLRKHGQYDIHDKWKEQADKLPNDTQVLEWAKEKFNWHEGDRVSDEMKEAIDKVNKKIEAKREELGDWYDSEVDKWLERCNELKKELDSYPEDKRGERWEEWKQIDKANTDEFEAAVKKSFADLNSRY